MILETDDQQNQKYELIKKLGEILVRRENIA